MSTLLSATIKYTAVFFPGRVHYKNQWQGMGSAGELLNSLCVSLRSMHLYQLRVHVHVRIRYMCTVGNCKRVGVTTVKNNASSVLPSSTLNSQRLLKTWVWSN